MGLAIVALIVFAFLDFGIMLAISRVPSLDTFTVGECFGLPIALFFLTGIELRAAGFNVPPWPLFELCYTIQAMLFFSLIGIRKSGYQNHSQAIKRSLLTAVVFSAIHFSAHTMIGLAIGA